MYANYPVYLFVGFVRLVVRIKPLHLNFLDFILRVAALTLNSEL